MCARARRRLSCRPPHSLRPLATLLVVLAALASPAPALADVEPSADPLEVDTERERGSRPRSWVNGDLAGYVQPGARAGGATLDTAHLHASLGSALPPMRGVLVTGELEVGYTRYRFDDFEALGAAVSEPIEDATIARFGPGLVWPVLDDLTLIVSGGVGFAVGDGAPLERALTYGAVSVLAWRVSDTLSLAAVLIANSRLDDDPLILPVAGFDWQPSERWRFELTGDIAGPTLRGRYRLGDEWWASLAGRWESDVYRIESDATGLGTVRDEQLTALAGVTWTPSPGVALGLRAGAALADTIVVDDRDTGRVGSERFGASPVAGAMLELAI